MADPAAAHEIERWLEEKRSAYLYRVLSDTESGTPRQLLFLELAKAADEQAGLWAKEIRKLDAIAPEHYAPDQRTRVIGWLVRKMGPRVMRPILAAIKLRGMALYSGNLRAAILGLNDGLVSNASLILGVAGATSDAHIVLLSGTAGLLAGAFSMAAGEFIAARSRREKHERQPGVERAELAQYPQEADAELAIIFKANGLEKWEAREALSLNLGESGSPAGAALFSFASFAAGGLIPLAPYLFNSTYSLPAAIGLTSLSLFAVGTALPLFTGRHALLGGLRMLIIGSVAGGTAYLIGSALGVMLSLV